jgi:hypothetical protein
MAINPKPSVGHRIGTVRDRSQFQTPAGNWAKRGPDGRIMAVKISDKSSFKGVRREK